MENVIPLENNLFNHRSGIIVEEGAKEVFLYLCGIDLEKDIRVGNEGCRAVVAASLPVAGFTVGETPLFFFQRCKRSQKPL